MKELTLEASIDNLGQVLCFIDEQLETINCPLREQMKIDVAVEEIFVNIASYAYAPDSGNTTVRIEIEKNPLAAVITFVDSGVPYDPLEKADPDVSLSLHEREIGGLGIFMVKKSMDSMTYQYEKGQNVLHIRKILKE